ncbi:MAG: DUF1566 domain-containing protein [Candidatus Saccharibacteria bacterium]|nr:DUF1566 domain-containing protein [Rhodoferax sp.]
MLATAWVCGFGWAAPPGVALLPLLPETPAVQPASNSSETAQSKAERQRKYAQIRAATEQTIAKEKAERKQLKAQAMAELNDRAGTGDMFAIQTLLHHAPSGADARPGLTAAAASGSKLATFIMAVWDHKAGDKNPALRKQALKTLQTLGDYYPAQYWMANQGEGSYDERQARLEKLVPPQGMWGDYLRAMQPCRKAAWKICLTQLDALQAQGSPWTAYPRALVLLHGSKEVVDISKGRSQLEIAYAQDRWKGRHDLQKILLAWLTLKGFGGVADVEKAQNIFAERGSTYIEKKIITAPLQGNGCGDLKLKSGWFYHRGDHRGGFDISSYTVFVDLPTEEAKIQAVASCQSLADAGDVDAMAWMGVAYASCIPECSDKNMEKRDQWFMQAAKAGNKYAAYALVAYASKRTLAAARQTVEKYSPQWDADTQFVARYNLAMASDAPPSELDDIMRQLKQRPDVWQTGWVQAMLLNLVESKKVKELETGDALRAYATQIELIDASGRLKIDWNYANERSQWFRSEVWKWNSVLETLEDESYYAIRVTECSAWTERTTYGSDTCMSIPEKLRARPLALAVQPDSPPIAVGDHVLLPSGTVQQKSKQLEWMPCSLGQTWDAQRRKCQGDALVLKHDELATALQKVNAGTGQFGRSDWRIPTLLELHGLIQCRYGTETKSEKLANGMVLAKCINDPLSRNVIPEGLFPNLISSLWTSTPANKKKRTSFAIYKDGWISDYLDSNSLILTRSTP